MMLAGCHNTRSLLGRWQRGRTLKKKRKNLNNFLFMSIILDLSGVTANLKGYFFQCAY